MTASAKPELTEVDCVHTAVMIRFEYLPENLLRVDAGSGCGAHWRHLPGNGGYEAGAFANYFQIVIFLFPSVSRDASDN
jgi:hypothetical protein